MKHGNLKVSPDGHLSVRTCAIVAGRLWWIRLSRGRNGRYSAFVGRGDHEVFELEAAVCDRAGQLLSFFGWSEAIAGALSDICNRAKV